MNRKGSSILGLMCTSALLAGCRAGPAAEESTPAPSVLEEPAASVANEGCIGTTQSVSHAPYTIENLAGASKFAILGTVGAVNDGVWNTSDGAAPAELVSRGAVPPNAAIFTPIDMSVDQSLLGDSAGGSIRVMNEGGSDGCSVMSVSGAPTLEPGATYVLFLRDGTDSEGKIRSDFNVVITAWPVDEKGNVATERDGTVTLDELTDRVAAASGGATSAPANVGDAVQAPTVQANSDLPACAGAAWPPVKLVGVDGVEVAAPDGVSVLITNRSKEQLYYQVDGWIAERNGDCVEYQARTVELGPLPAGESVTSDVARLSSTMDVPYSISIWDRPCGEMCSEPPMGALLIAP